MIPDYQDTKDMFDLYFKLLMPFLILYVVLHLPVQCSRDSEVPSFRALLSP